MWQYSSGRCPKLIRNLRSLDLSAAADDLVAEHRRVQHGHRLPIAPELARAPDVRIDLAWLFTAFLVKDVVGEGDSKVVVVEAAFSPQVLGEQALLPNLLRKK